MKNNGLSQWGFNVEILVELKLPHQKAQIVRVRRLLTGQMRVGIRDRFDRLEWLNGEEIGFGIIVFQTLKFPKIARLVVRNDWSEALFRNFEGQSVQVEIKVL